MVTCYNGDEARSPCLMTPSSAFSDHVGQGWGGLAQDQALCPGPPPPLETSHVLLPTIGFPTVLGAIFPNQQGPCFLPCL